MATTEDSWEGSTAVVKSSPAPKLSKRLSEKFERTKEVASAGVGKTKAVAYAGVEKTKTAARKVKDGATGGVNWIKLKCKIFQRSSKV